jgi:Bacterial SH3 domain
MANSDSVKMGERQRHVPGAATRIGPIRTVWRACLFMILFFAFCPTRLLAQEATTNRNVILRRDPTTSSPALEHLTKGARLTLVDALLDSGFYHVKTENDRVGWIFAKYVSISTAQTPPTPPPQVTAPPSTAASTECDSSLSTHVYHPNRLIVKQECIAVTGTIVDATATQTTKEPDGTRHEPDGDTHGWLKVDSGFENLLNSGNINDEAGNLVFEIICKFPVTQPDAKAACQGFTDHVSLPPVGSHARIVGRYVQDTFHGQWNEIHPVTSITVTP